MSKKMDFREYECELIKVVDGDTIDCWIDLGFKTKLKKRVRYMGLDTWESRTRDLEEKKKGLAAKARNKELIEEVSSKSGYFRLKSHGVGKYGRVLGEIFILDKSKSSQLLKGYQSVRKLNYKEKSNFNTLCRGSALRYLLTRSYDYLNTPKKALIKIKDPKEYLDKLNFHRKLNSFKDYS